MHRPQPKQDRKSTRLNSSHTVSSYAAVCLKKKKITESSALFLNCTGERLTTMVCSPTQLAASWQASCSAFFFNDTATTEIYTLSLHDALPISHIDNDAADVRLVLETGAGRLDHRSEEHTSELQSHSDLVCRLLLEKKKKT